MRNREMLKLTSIGGAVVAVVIVAGLLVASTFFMFVWNYAVVDVVTVARNVSYLQSLAIVILIWLVRNSTNPV